MNDKDLYDVDNKDRNESAIGVEIYVKEDGSIAKSTWNEGSYDNVKIMIMELQNILNEFLMDYAEGLRLTKE